MCVYEIKENVSVCVTTPPRAFPGAPDAWCGAKLVADKILARWIQCGYAYAHKGSIHLLSCRNVNRIAEDEFVRQRLIDGGGGRICASE